MFRLWRKLKSLQPHMRKIAYRFAKVSQEVTEKRKQLDTLQAQLATDRFNPGLLEEIRVASEQLLSIHKFEEEILRQKSKITWLNLGDGNNSYFHASIKAKK